MIRIYFFRGSGLVPLIVRLFCWKWWIGEKFSQVPAHCSLVMKAGSYLVEFEATVKGISCHHVPDKMSGVIHYVDLAVPDERVALSWLSDKIGSRYGFEAVAIDGISVVAPPWVDKCMALVWRRLEKGRSSPLHCSLLCLGAINASGFSPVPSRPDGLPVSPNDLLISLKGLRK